MDEIIWTEEGRHRWPRLPGNNRFLAQAADMIGRYLFGDEWKIADMAVRIALYRPKPPFRARPILPPRSLASAGGGGPAVAADEQMAQQRREYDDRCSLIDKLNAEAAEANKVLGPPWKRAGEVQRAIIGQAAEGNLKTFYRSEVDGEPVAIPMTFWAMMSAHLVFSDCRIYAQPWMRNNDDHHRHAIFIPDDQLRRIDWTKVEWRAEPEPLGKSDQLQSPATLPPVSASALRAWVEAQRAAGASQEMMAEKVRTAFPGHEAPSGNAVKRIDRALGRIVGRPRESRRVKVGANSSVELFWVRVDFCPSHSRLVPGSPAGARRPRWATVSNR